MPKTQDRSSARSSIGTFIVPPFMSKAHGDIECMICCDPKERIPIRIQPASTAQRLRMRCSEVWWFDVGTKGWGPRQLGEGGEQRGEGRGRPSLRGPRDSICFQEDPPKALLYESIAPHRR